MNIKSQDNIQQIVIAPNKRLIDILSKKLPTDSFIEDKQKPTTDESHFTKDVSRTSLFKKRSRKPQKWTDEDTSTFYKCLEIFGMDFAMISEVLSHKTQRQILRKFHKERKRDPTKIDMILQNHESNLIQKDMRARSFLEGVFRLTSNSEASDNNTSDDSLEIAVAKKLKLLIENPKKEDGENLQPLEYYLKQLD